LVSSSGSCSTKVLKIDGNDSGALEVIVPEMGRFFQTAAKQQFGSVLFQQKGHQLENPKSN